ncbi:MAG TPA: sugar phosphate isomerase/epimerase family protein, partial [Gemmataceae bacterium]|nr:sugar phosphate isomerase/epimerase family protein [Gemmataceae bacterium]
MLLGYNTNGFAHHRLADIISILADLGYQSIAITLDYHCLDPYADHLANELVRVRHWLEKRGLRSVVETGARFLLNPREKHQPTLISPEGWQREDRLEFLMHSVDIANELGSDVVGFWSGSPKDNAPPSVLMERLVEGCKRLCDYAAERKVRLAFEPEPGMFIDTMDKFAELHARVNHPAFGLTIDIGHLVCNGELPVSRFLADWGHVLWNVHV